MFVSGCSPGLSSNLRFCSPTCKIFFAAETSWLTCLQHHGYLYTFQAPEVASSTVFCWHRRCVFMAILPQVLKEVQSAFQAEVTLSLQRPRRRILSSQAAHVRRPERQRCIIGRNCSKEFCVCGGTFFFVGDHAFCVLFTVQRRRRCFGFKRVHSS